VVFLVRDEEEKRQFDSDGDDELVNKEDSDIYDEENIEEQLDAGEISPEEAGFMEGYDTPNLIKCKKCKKCGKEINALDLEKCKEEVIDGKTTWICDTCIDEDDE
jgi:hypothetical protein